jgi:hypothetical protein
MVGRIVPSNIARKHVRERLHGWITTPLRHPGKQGARRLVDKGCLPATGIAGCTLGELDLGGARHGFRGPSGLDDVGLALGER